MSGPLEIRGTYMKLFSNQSNKQNYNKKHCLFFLNFHYLAILFDSARWRHHAHSNQHIFNVTVNTVKKIILCYFLKEKRQQQQFTITTFFSCQMHVLPPNRQHTRTRMNQVRDPSDSLSSPIVLQAFCFTATTNKTKKYVQV